SGGDGCGGGRRRQQLEAVGREGRPAGDAARPQLLQGTLDGQVRILGEQFLQDRLERIDDAGTRARPGCRRGPARALRLYAGQRADHRAPRDAQVLGDRRSEEHTSELQSLTNLVCRLLLEKKKKSIRQNEQVTVPI